jgi:lipooligosaccharide transport system ATP-binding protein
MLPNEVIRATEVRKVFGAFTAVAGVSFAIRRGECFGLLGPNGAGKSTLISMLYGAAERSDGDLQVFGLDPGVHARSIKKRSGVVTQDNALDESLSVRENMEIYAAYAGVPSSQRRSRVQELLQYMNLDHKQNDPIRFLSGGMKRRLVFVRALINQPELIILDEPTTGLDPAVRHLLWGKVSELKAQGKTILLTTHYMHEAEVLCDRLLIMSRGQVVAEGSPQELRARYTPGYVAVFDQTQMMTRLKAAAESAELQVSQDSSGLYVRAPQLDVLLRFQKDTQSLAVQLRPSNLEDVFLKLTGQELSIDA